MFPVLAPHQIIKTAPEHAEIYQYDGSPLADRQPLLVTHGLRDEYMPQFHMEVICNYLLKDETFRKRYKIFLLRYNTNQPTKTAIEEFKTSIKALAKEEAKPLTVVAVSLSGNVVRNAMSDPEVDQSITRVFTLGAAFHGTPFFSRDWMAWTFQKHFNSVKLLRTSAYKAYFERHPNLLVDYYWDNCDDQIPHVGKFTYKTPLTISGDLMPPTIPPPGGSAKEHGEKLTAYASYIETSLTKRSPKGIAAIPHTIAFAFGTTFPAFIGKQHSMLRVMNYAIARAVVRDTSREGVYAFNDGIAPSVSSLSLSDTAALTCNLSSKEEIEKLKGQLNVKKARLLTNADHCSFLDGRSPDGKNKNVRDVLNPDEKPKPIFAWLLGDILN